MSLKEQLAESTLFTNVESSCLEKISSASEAVELTPGQALFYEGDNSDALYIVRNGTIKIIKSGQEGDQDLAKIGSGSHLGEMTFLHSPEEGAYEKRTASAEAVEASTLIKVPFSILVEHTKAHPAFGCVFYKAIAQNLSARIQKTDEDLVSLKSLRLRHV